MHPRLHGVLPTASLAQAQTQARSAGAAAAAAAADPSAFDLGLSLESQVQCGLCLVLRLKTPAQMPALLATVKSVAPQVHAALAGLHYVHFARFVPTPDFSALLVVTEFDGDPSTPQTYQQSMNSYLMDFVVVLGDVFNAMLDFVAGAPRLPVQQYPRDFIAFVAANNLPIPVWSSSPADTVIDIQTARQ